MATVYSYVRFSHKKQEQGDSLRRQLAMGKAWLDRHPEHILDQTLRLRDLGVSAFRGANLDKEKGDLGKFIHLAKTGQIPQGSILMLERLDRFSRQPPRKASRIFYELVEAGVKVLTLDPEQLIDETNVDNMEVVLPITIYMQIAYEQSREKRRRVGNAWKEKRKQATHRPMSRRCPSWLVWNEKAKGFDIRPDGQAALNYIFNRSAEGAGQIVITHELNAKFLPLGRSNHWNSSFVQKVLNDRAVLGELQPHTFNETGERVPDGQPIPDYYPRVIPDDLFYRVQSAKKTRIKAKGRNGLFVNLFTGLVVGKDGFPRHIQTTRWTRKKDGSFYVQRRLVSWGHLRGLKGASSVSYDYYSFEAYVLAALEEIRASDLISKQNPLAIIACKEQELSGVVGRLEQLEDELTQLSKPIPQVVSAMATLSDKIDRLKNEIDTLKQSVSVDDANPYEQASGVLELLASKPTTDAHNLRLKLRAIIASIVKSIEIEPFKVHGFTTGAKIAVETKNGITKVFWDWGKTKQEVPKQDALRARAEEIRQEFSALVF